MANSCRRFHLRCSKCYDKDVYISTVRAGRDGIRVRTWENVKGLVLFANAKPVDIPMFQLQLLLFDQWNILKEKQIKVINMF